VLLLGGGGALIGFAIKDKKTIDANTAELNKLGYTAPEEARRTVLTGENSDLTSRRTKFLYGSYFGIIIGLVAIAYSFVPLKKSINSKRQLEGIALGPTRLQWTGGMGARLRF